MLLSFSNYKQTNHDTCSTEIWHHPSLFPAFARLLCQISPTFCFFIFLKVPLVYILVSSSPPVIHSAVLSFCLLFIFCASPQSSSSSFFCSQTDSLLDATWDTFSPPVPRFSHSPFVSRPDSLEGKPSPPLSHWVSPFPLHPDCPKSLPYLCHTTGQCPDSHIQYRLD